MATGPEHYLRAEGLVSVAARLAARTEDADLLEDPERMRDFRESVASTLAAAQVHATLALAAATAGRSRAGELEAVAGAWDEVLGL